MHNYSSKRSRCEAIRDAMKIHGPSICIDVLEVVKQVSRIRAHTPSPASVHLNIECGEFTALSRRQVFLRSLGNAE
jgi:hypothetical protein